MRPIYQFVDKIFHVHCKDIKLCCDKLDQVGIMATTLQYMAPKILGLGATDWGRFVSVPIDTGYSGGACLEIEDRAFDDSPENIVKAILRSGKYMRSFV